MRAITDPGYFAERAELGGNRRRSHPRASSYPTACKRTERGGVAKGSARRGTSEGGDEIIEMTTNRGEKAFL